jgi:hypothetical protein
MAPHALADGAPRRARIGIAFTRIAERVLASITGRRNGAVAGRRNLDLLALDDRMLADIGIDRWEIEHELHSRWHGDQHLERALNGSRSGRPAFRRL